MKGGWGSWDHPAEKTCPREKQRRGKHRQEIRWDGGQGDRDRTADAEYNHARGGLFKCHCQYSRPFSGLLCFGERCRSGARKSSQEQMLLTPLPPPLGLLRFADLPTALANTPLHATGGFQELTSTFPGTGTCPKTVAHCLWSGVNPINQSTHQVATLS